VKLHVRKSSIKRRRMHGFRNKPYTHRPRGKKLKNLKLKLKARRKRRIHLDGSN
jgi:ribosomal protein L16/L10AE